MTTANVNMNANALLAAMYKALAAPIGVLIETSDPIRLMRALQALKTSDAAFAVLSFRTSPVPEGNVVIVRSAKAQAAVAAARPTIMQPAEAKAE